MDLHHEHVLVVRPVEDADPAALRQAPHVPPEEVVVQLLGRRLLEAEDLAALRIDAGHDVLDRAVLAGRVHRLEDDQDGVSVVGVEQVLGLGEFRQVLFQDSLARSLTASLPKSLNSSDCAQPGLWSFSRLSCRPARETGR